METANITGVEQYVTDQIRNIRKANHTTQKDLAKILHTSTSFVGNVEAGAGGAKYNLKHIYLVAAHFKISPRLLIPEH